MPNYHNWTCHGELFLGLNVGIYMSSERETTSISVEESSTIIEMIFDTTRPSFDPNFANYIYEETPNLEVHKFYDMLKPVETPLWEGCKTDSQLSATEELLSIKSKNHWIQK